MVNKLFTKKRLFVLIVLKMDMKLNEKLKNKIFFYKAPNIGPQTLETKNYFSVFCIIFNRKC